MTKQNLSSENLWTKDFTILTIGSIISMLGNTLSGFAIGLMVLDFTNSTFMYAASMIIYNLPKIILPSLAGPYLDKFSRKKVIYTLDFISAGFFFILYLLLNAGNFTYLLIIIMNITLGAIGSVYDVAYESFYPNLITKGNYSKAYSISSMIYPLAALMTPVAAIVYEKVGIAPLFLFNAISFLTAAIFETQIKATDKHLINSSEGDVKYSFKTYIKDFKYGMNYIKSEKGLLAIVTYFTLSCIIYGVSDTLYLPYFKSVPALGTVTYSFVMAFAVGGRFIGGLIHYKFKYPPNKRFTIAVCIYILTAFIEGTFLFAPVIIMIILQFTSGMLSVTSYNIRISSTQNYLPEHVRGRYNGTFQMLFNLGLLIGQFIFGILGEIFPIRAVVFAAYLCGFSLTLIMFRNKEHVSKIYNADI